MPDAVVRAHALEVSENVRAHHHGDAALSVEADEQRAQARHARGVNARERLVEQQDLGVADEREGDAESLALPG